jgi:hypothetical protein
MRPDVYRYYANQMGDTTFMKVHDAYSLLPSGEPMFPANCSKGVVYFIRNPWDVSVSFANHSATEISKSINRMNDQSFGFCRSTIRPHNQLRQQLYTWSNHVKSWTEQTNIPVQVIRYEDMYNDSFNTFKKAVKFCGIDKSDDEIAKAIQNSSFEKLQEQEKVEGFKEKPLKANSFFRSGIVGDWKEHLSTSQSQQLLNNHRNTLNQFNYNLEITTN